MNGGLYGLDQVIRTVLARSLRDDWHKSYTLDIDTTPIEAAKKSARMTYKGFRGYNLFRMFELIRRRIRVYIMA